jgi:hypothetical protein
METMEFEEFNCNLFFVLSIERKQMDQKICAVHIYS